MLLFLLSVLLVLTNACDCITSLEGITNYSNFPMYSNYSYQWMYYLLNDGVTSNNMLFLLKNSNNNCNSTTDTYYYRLFHRNSEHNTFIEWEDTLNSNSVDGDDWKKVKDNMGEELWLNGLREKSQKGFESVTKNGIWKKTKPEIEYENKLISENKDYIFNYKLDGKYFDFYIPSENKLVEIDGKFYHPLTIEECIYDFQKRNYYNDIKKNKIAKNNNLIIERIRV